MSLVALWMSATDCLAQASGTRGIEAQVKAAFLYKFCAYVAWPAQAFERADSPFVIAVVDDEVFAEVLEQVTSGHNVSGRPIEVHRQHKGADLAGAQIAYVAGSDAATLAGIVAASKGQPVLIVTDTERGLSQGGMINFVLEQDKVRFDIAPMPAEQNNLKISARLLSVARKVLGKAS